MKITREEWLVKVSTKYILPLLKKHGGNIDYKFRVSVGFPKGRRGSKGHAIGQCWDPTMSADKTHEIFISPTLSDFDAIDTAIHEHVHASVGLAAGHKGPFRKLATAVGLTGKMTATVPTDELRATINKWLSKIEVYPHAKMTSFDGSKPRPGSRMLKAYCGCCGYTVRTTRQWLRVAVPVCPDPDCQLNGTEMEVKL